MYSGCNNAYTLAESKPISISITLADYKADSIADAFALTDSAVLTWAT